MTALVDRLTPHRGGRGLSGSDPAATAASGAGCGGSGFIVG